MKLRRLLRILHRDMGYFIIGMTVVYVVSGIYLNHRHDFNPDYKTFYEEVITKPLSADNYNKDSVINVMNMFEVNPDYRKHYITNQGNIKVFIENGEVIINPETGEAKMTYLKKRPVIFEMNLLHKASVGTIWKWVSDTMAVILFFVAVSGLFLLKGKRGFARWGWVWTISGVMVPLIFVLLYI